MSDTDSRLALKPVLLQKKTGPCSCGIPYPKNSKYKEWYFLEEDFLLV